MPRRSVFLLASLVLLLAAWSRAAEDLMDQYLSIPGSFVFVRRAPEGAQPDRLIMTVFEDFMCPACYRAATEIFPHLKEKYGAKLEIHFLGFPFVHQESRLAARAYVIAHELGYGEEMQQALFRAHFEQQIDIASKEGLAKVADSIGLASEVLLKQLAADGGNAELTRTLAQADSYQVDGTPTIILDGWIKVTDISQANLEQVIDGLLARKKAAAATKPAGQRRKAAP
ncbi:MAG TPA: DsbA family protein [Methylomirabilota bacterium]|nr:DsbA family protein [Methylomirabilota bacterium]